MEDPERVRRAAEMWAAVERSTREENERLEAAAALARCERCPEPKRLRDEVLTLAGGLRLSVYTTPCSAPGPDCTAAVSSHIVSEPPAVANRIVERLAADPKLAAAGVTCMIPLHWSAERFVLSFRVPTLGRVNDALSGAANAEPDATADTGT
ncbi:MAG: hypothetical protein ACRC7O_10730 [Fimbriiglobus sp.]